MAVSAAAVAPSLAVPSSSWPSPPPVAVAHSVNSHQPTAISPSSTTIFVCLLARLFVYILVVFSHLI